MARTTNILVVALVLGIATSVRAHTCLLDPLQRNGAPGALTKVADPACGLNAAPCGGTKVGSPSASYQAGTTASITWVKNLNHYNSAAPGNFTLYGYNNGMRGPMLYTVADTNTPSLTQYHADIPIPSDAQPGDYVLQLIYYTGRGFNFYQCADVELTASN